MVVQNMYTVKDKIEVTIYLYQKHKACVSDIHTGNISDAKSGIYNYFG